MYEKEPANSAQTEPTLRHNMSRLVKANQETSELIAQIEESLRGIHRYSEPENAAKGENAKLEEAPQTAIDDFVLQNKIREAQNSKLSFILRHLKEIV